MANRHVPKAVELQRAHWNPDREASRNFWLLWGSGRILLWLKTNQMGGAVELCPKIILVKKRLRKEETHNLKKNILMGTREIGPNPHQRCSQNCGHIGGFWGASPKWRNLTPRWNGCKLHAFGLKLGENPLRGYGYGQLLRNDPAQLRCLSTLQVWHPYRPHKHQTFMSLPGVSLSFRYGRRLSRSDMKTAWCTYLLDNLAEI